MDGKKEFISVLSKTLTNSGNVKTGSTTRPYRTLQSFSSRSTSNKSISQRSSSPQEKGRRTKPKRPGNGGRRQTGRKNVYGLRKRRRAVSMAKQRSGYGISRTSGRNVMKKSKGIGITYRTKNFKTKIIRKSSNGKSGRISGTEYLTNLQPDNTLRNTTGATFFQSNISPLLIIGSRLAQEAKMWQEYKVKKWKYIFTSACPTTVAGQIGIGITSDPTMTLNEQGDTAIRKFEALDFHSEHNPWESVVVDFTGHGEKWYKVSPSEDSILFIAGKAFFINYSPISAIEVVGSLGKVHIEYDLEFRDPFIQPGLVPTGANYETNLVGNGVNTISGTPYNLGTGNFSVAPDTKYVYQLIVIAGITQNTSPVIFGTNNYPINVTAGTVWYIKYDTKDQRWYFYDYTPDNEPNHDDSVLISNTTLAVGAMVGTVALFPVEEENNV